MFNSICFTVSEVKKDNMSYVTVDEKLCKGCGLCVHSCPKNVLELSEHKLNANGYPVAEPVRKENCIGCAFCAIMCPDCAIEVYKE